MPVVTTTNPPLKRICDESGVGVADDEYAEGINTVLANYEAFKRNIETFVIDNSIKGNDEKLISEISKIIRS